MTTIAILGVFFLAVCDCCGNKKSEGWEYQYEVIFPGTRSEYVIGTLTYQGKQIPELFGHIITPVGEFAFIKAGGCAHGPRVDCWIPVFDQKHLNGNGPYVFNQPYSVSEKMIKEYFSERNESFRSTKIKDPPVSVSGEASKSGTLVDRAIDVGADWFLAVSQSLWVNPAKVDAVLKDIVVKPAAPNP